MVNISMNKKIIKYLDNNIINLENKNILLIGKGYIGSAIYEELKYKKANVFYSSSKDNNADILIDFSKDINFDEIKKLNLDYIVISSGVDIDDNINELVNYLGPKKLIDELKNDVIFIVCGSISKRKDSYAINKRKLLDYSNELKNDNIDIRIFHPGIVYSPLFKKRNKLSFLYRFILNNKYKSALCALLCLNKKQEYNYIVCPKNNINGYPKEKRI